MPKTTAKATHYAPFPSVVAAFFSGVLSLTLGGVAALAIRDNAVAGLLLLLGGVAVPCALLLYTYVRARVSCCSFCATRLEQAKWLVSAPVRGVAICERCAPLALAIVAKEGELGWMSMTDALPDLTPRAVSTPLIDAMVARASSAADLRAASASAQRMSNWAVAERALSKIAEAARTPNDWMSLGVFVGKQRRYEDALALTQRAKLGARQDAGHMSILANNLAWFWAKTGGASSYRGGVVTRDDAEPWLRSLDEAARTLEKEQPESWKTWFMHCVGTRAEILRIAGDLDGALASFARAAEKCPLSPERLMCRAQVHAARGANAEAIGDLEAALRQLHPESEGAEEARELLKRSSPFG